jgi:REP-associated tyrosine transposase
MQVMPDHPTRKPLRLVNHDYSQAGPYFVTICTQNKSNTLGTVCGEQVDLSPAGQLAREVWYALPERFPQLVFDEFIMMPNHLHAILAFVGAGLAPPAVGNAKNDRANSCSLPSIIGAFKSISTIKINRLLRRRGQPFWQRSYYEHIIRNGDDMKNAQRYILENPSKWSSDPEHPKP